MRRDIRLDLDSSVESVEGQGSALVVRVNGYRKNKAGNVEHYRLRLNVDRYDVKILLAGLRDMHVRDRQRLALEQQRIDQEATILIREQK